MNWIISLLATIVVAETQLYPVREQSRGYLGRYPDQPLCLDRTIDISAAYDGGRYAQGDIDTYRQWAKDYGIDGFSTFTWSRPFVAEACKRSAVQGLSNVHIIAPGIRTEKVEQSIRTAVEDPNALKHDGGTVFLTFDAWRMKPADLKARYDEIRRTYGCKCVFVTDTPQLANHHYRNTFRSTGRLSPEQVAELENHLRDYLRVSDGIYVLEQWLMQKIVKNERIFDYPYYREVMRITRRVLDEPEFQGKLLAVAVANGHENHYTCGYLAASEGTRMFRENFEAAIEFKADLINLFEWDEWNENTSSLPTLYNSYSCKRMTRYYMSRLHNEAPTPIAGDDTSLPNLIVSYRRQLDDNEPFYVEVLNVPDGSRQGKLKCTVRLADAENRPLYTFPTRTIDQSAMSEARFELPAETLAGLPPAFRVHVAWADEADQRGKLTEGLLPVDHRPGAGWMHKCVKQPLRDLARMTSAEVGVDADGRITARLECEEPLRYVMLCGDGLIQYIHNPEDPASRFRSTNEIATFAISQYKWRRWGGDISYRVEGIPETEWLTRLDRPQIARGEAVTFREVSMWDPSYYLSIPRSKLDAAKLKVEIPGLLQTEFPLKAVAESGGWAQGGSNGLEVAVASFKRQATYPVAWNRRECAFAVVPDMLSKSGVFYVQAVTMSGKTWRSKPLFLGDFDSPTRLEYDFSPRTGDAVWPKSGERRYVGIAGGPFQLLTQFNRGASAEGPLAVPEIAKLSAEEHETHPRRELVPEVGWALFFDGEDDYLGLPRGVIPPNAGFKLAFDVFPERTLDEEFILGARNEGRGSLSGVQLSKGMLRLDYMGMNFEHTSFLTGLKVEPGRWNHIEIVNTGDRLRATVNGQSAERDCCRPGRGYTALCVGGDGKYWFKGGLANLVIQHSSTFENPVIAENWPDPTVVDGGDGWYYTHATMRPTVFRSKDLIHWQDLKVDPLEPSARHTLTNLTKNLWAPSLVKLQDRWVLYISLFINSDDNRIEALTAEHPSGPFTYAGNIISSQRIGIQNTIDPYVLESDGHVWMFFGSSQDGIHRIELTKDGLATLPGAKPLHVAGRRKGSDRKVNLWGKPGTYEGSYVMKRGAWWYLFVSGGLYTDGTYHLAVGRSARLEGPYTDRQGTPLIGGVAQPILRSSVDERFTGPGHNGDVFQTADGRYWMFYHAHDAKAPSLRERRLMLQELKWTDDDWPYFENSRPRL